MYVDKFLGLSDQFGPGCEVVRLDIVNFKEQLASALEKSWQLADQVHVSLQEASQRQIELGWVAYQRVKKIIDSNTT